MAVWNGTAEGQALDGAFSQMLNAYNNTVPGHVQQLKNAAQRPITG